MLLSFSVSGFRGFAEPSTLSMVATKDRSHQNTNTFETGLPGEVATALRVALVVGANAAGKTSLLDALAQLIDLIAHSRQLQPNAFARGYQPHALADKRSEQTEFVLELSLEGIRYEYSLSYDADGVREESLVLYAPSQPRKIFERRMRNAADEQRTYHYAFGPTLKGSKTAWASSTRPTALFISTLIENNNKQAEPLNQWVSNNFIYLPNSTSVNDQRMLAILNNSEGEEKAARYKQYLLKLFHCADIPITDVKTRALQQTADRLEFGGHTYALEKNTEEKQIFPFFDAQFQHRRSDGKDFWLPFQSESSGTKRLFSLAGPMFEAMENGSLLVIDEYSSSLSTRLSEHFLTLFQSSSNVRDGQIIATTHDAQLMSQSLMRRDQLWILDQPEEFCAELVGLTEYKTRKGEAVPKNYLAGRYGGLATPNPLQATGSDS